MHHTNLPLLYSPKHPGKLMIAPQIPKNEDVRLKDLSGLDIMDTLQEEDYDNITRIASQICETPISLITLIDEKRQWFKSKTGLSVNETPREFAFCAHAINEPTTPFIVEDARDDERFLDNPLVTGLPNVIFYAGIPLVTQQGSALGTLCVIDNKPKVLNKDQLASLKALGKQVMNLLELRRSKLLLEKSLTEITEKNLELDQFASTAAHDIKSPLAVIKGYTQIIINDYQLAITPAVSEMLDRIDSAASHLNDMVNGMLSFSRSTDDLKNHNTIIFPEHLIDKIRHLVKADYKISIELKTNLEELVTNHTVLEQVLINLISNAIKYNDKEVAKILVEINEDENYYHFAVRDNGIGINAEDRNRIFEIFKTTGAPDRYGNKGTGIGLATVKKLINALEGSISVESEPMHGSCFSFSLKK